jgi:glutaredoxin
MSETVTIPTADTLTVYGADWCGDCRRTKRYLAETATPYTWIDTDAQPEQRALLRAAGYPGIPVVVVPGGAILMEPSNGALAEALATVEGTGASA